MRISLTLLCATSLLFLASCQQAGQNYFNRALQTPRRAISLDAANSSYSSYQARTRYEYVIRDGPQYFRNAYDTAVAAGNGKTVRNSIAKEMVALLDENHAIYHESLRKSLTANNVMWDFLTLGLTSSAAVATGAQATRALSAIATGTNGFGAKMSGRILQEQTLATVFKAIRIRKEQAFQRMQLKFAQTTGDYDLEDVLVDLGRYWEAGLLSSGIQQLDEMTSKTINAVEQKKNESGGNKSTEAAEVLKVVNGE